MSLASTTPELAASSASRAARTPGLGGGRRFVLVTGGKGGVGKTTVAANLAVSLAAAGRATRGAHTDHELAPGGAEDTHAPLLVDLDLGLANLDLLLGLEPNGGLDRFLLGELALEEALVRGPDGLGVLLAGSGSGELAHLDDACRERLVAGLAELAERFGLVVGDSAAGIGRDVLSFAARADRVLVVTTPEPAAMTDAYGLLKALDGYARDSAQEVPTPELFVNLAADAVEARAVGERLAGVCRRFLSRSPRLVGWMPRSRIVLRSVAARTPFVSSHPESAPARCIQRLARRFAGLLPSAAPVAAPGGGVGQTSSSPGSRA